MYLNSQQIRFLKMQLLYVISLMIFEKKDIDRFEEIFKI